MGAPYKSTTKLARDNCLEEITSNPTLKARMLDNIGMSAVSSGADSTFVVQNISDDTKEVGFSVGGATTGKATTLTFVNTDDRAITFPDASVTLASVTGTETLTNKTLTAPVLGGSVTGTYTLAGTATLTNPVINKAAVARTATTDGTTTGTIADSGFKQHITVTSDSADKIIILPTPTPGVSVVLDVGATGFELRSSAPATVAINGGTGTAAESAIAASSTVFMTCVSATAWKGFFMDADGDLAKVEAAAP